MWLRNLVIKNFRKITELDIQVPRGLAILVGENNSGKTAIIDALRLLLFSGRDFASLHLTEDDFRAGTDFLPIEISGRFTGLNEEDEVHFQECLVDIGDGVFEMQVNARVELNRTTGRCGVRTWGGETEGGRLPLTFYDRLAAVYLQPLRDPDSGLRPGQNSQVSRLVDCLTPEDQRGAFEVLAAKTNDEIRKLKPIRDAKNDINSQMAKIAGNELSQSTNLIFAEPDFRRIIAGLRPEIDGLPFGLNGLGYNNLVFAAMTLGTLRKSEVYSHRSVLIEEPEAHLHPQLQVLLLQHLASVAQIQDDNEVQAIASSHSPILASQAPIDSVIVVHDVKGSVNAVSLCGLEIDEKLKKKLQRYLDATRAELFFARKVLMVEGISEALMLPMLAKMSGGSLKNSAVTMINADGLNFNAFIPVFGKDHINVPVAILTDGDADDVGGEPSPTATKLKAREGEVDSLRVEIAEVTFEHELARQSEMLPYMLEAFKELHPINGAKLETALSSIGPADSKARKFLKEFLATKVSKGCFAQELLTILADSNASKNAVPMYIRRALAFLGVIKEDVGNGKD